MKCIKSKSSGKIERVENELALQKVNSGTYVYVDKQEWKKQTRA